MTNTIQFYEEQFRTKLGMFSTRSPMLKNVDKEDYSIMMKLLNKMTTDFKLSDDSLSLISQLRMLDNMRNPKEEGSGVSEILAHMTLNYIFVELKREPKFA